MWTFLIALIVGIAAERAGYYRHDWKLVRARMQYTRTVEHHDERIAAWLDYQERVETELEQLRRDAGPDAELAEAQRLGALRLDLRTANATINRLEGSLAQVNASFDDLLAKYRALRALKAPTDAWAESLLVPAERPDPPVFDFDADQSEKIEVQRTALATVSRLAPVKSYPAKSRPRRKRRR